MYSNTVGPALVSAYSVADSDSAVEPESATEQAETSAGPTVLLCMYFIS